MTVAEAAAFHPFFHEIVAVHQDTDPEAPIKIVGTVWPCLMFGEMLFNRAEVRVRAGSRHAVAGESAFIQHRCSTVFNVEPEGEGRKRLKVPLGHLENGQA